MRSVIKAVAATAIMVPVMLGGAQVASADDGPAYKKSANSATVHGGMELKIKSGFYGDTAYFHKSGAVATPYGAMGVKTASRS